MQYYDLFKEEPENTICVLLLFSPMAVMKIQTKQMIAFQMMNKNTIGRQRPHKSSHSRDKLESYIGDYNTMYGTSFTTKDSESFQNISKVSAGD
jgi:type I restriction enzyme R subunit